MIRNENMGTADADQEKSEENKANKDDAVHEDGDETEKTEDAMESTWKSTQKAPRKVPKTARNRKKSAYRGTLG